LGLKNRRDFVKLQGDNPKVHVFCALSEQKMYWPFFFADSIITGAVYLDVLENWLGPKMTEDIP
jgi:hypothetical protein